MRKSKTVMIPWMVLFIIIVIMTATPGSALVRETELVTAPLEDGQVSREVQAPAQVKSVVRPGLVKRYSEARGFRFRSPVRPIAPGGELETAPLTEVSSEPDSPGSGAVAGIWARVEPDHVHLDESFTLVVEIRVPDRADLSALTLPGFPDLDLINQSEAESFVTEQGKVYYQRTYRYVWLARESGTHGIPALKIGYAGRIYATPFLNVEVEGARTGLGYQKMFSRSRPGKLAWRSSAPETEKKSLAAWEIQASLARPSVYVQQAVRYEVKARGPLDRPGQLVYRPPTFSGFSMESIPVQGSDENVSNARLRRVERIFSTLLFPLSSGRKVIGAAEIRVGEGESPLLITSEELSLEVRPLPPDPQPLGPPSALVGNFHLELKPESERAAAGQPFRLRVRLQGQGNLRLAPEPWLGAGQAVQFYQESKQETIAIGKETVEGEREYHYLAVFKQSGISEITARIRYFDPGEENWKTAQAVLPALEVKAPKIQAPAAAPNRRQGWFLRPNHGLSGPLERVREPVNLRGFWLFQAAGPLLWLLAFWSRRQEEKAQLDSKTLREKNAYSEAQKARMQIRKYLQSGNQELFYQELTRATLDYLSAKLDVPATLLTGDRLAEYFESRQLPNYLSRQFKAALTACEYVRYGAAVMPLKDMRVLFADWQTALREFEDQEKRRKNFRGREAVGWLLALAAAGSLAHAGNQDQAELHFLRGNGMAEQQNFLGAETEYAAAVSLGVEDPNLWYNLGNAYARQGRRGYAVLAYRRGLRLAPRDPDLLAHWRLVRVQTRSFPGIWEFLRFEFFPGVYGTFTGRELSAGATVCYWLFILIWAAVIRWPRRFHSWGKMGMVCMLAWGISAGWAVLRETEPKWRKSAVVLMDQAALHGDPAQAAEVTARLPEGLELALGQDQDEWVEVILPSHRRGWMQRGALGRVE